MIKPEDMNAEWQDGYGVGLNQGRADAIEEVRRGINNMVSEYMVNGTIRADLITRYIDSKCGWIKEQSK